MDCHPPLVIFCYTGCSDVRPSAGGSHRSRFGCLVTRSIYGFCVEPRLICSMPKYVVRDRRDAVPRDHDHPRRRGFLRGTQVIARTDRGLECSIVLCEATEESTKELKNPTQGQILRHDAQTMATSAPAFWPSSARVFEVPRIGRLSRALEMELVDVEHVFGGERIVVYYLAENRVDFRELVKQLGRRVSNPDRNAANRRARRSQAAGRLRRLRQAGLLQHAPAARCRRSP